MAHRKINTLTKIIIKNDAKSLKDNLYKNIAFSYALWYNFGAEDIIWIL